MKFRDPVLLTDTGESVTPLEAEVGSPVRLGHLPAWLKTRLTPHRRRLNCADHFHTLFRLGANASWLDHWGSTVGAQGQELFVSEPYPLGPRDLQAILIFAETLGLEVTLSAASHHFPTGVTRFTFMPKQEAPT
jgi:hypothetical protein